MIDPDFLRSCLADCEVSLVHLSGLDSVSPRFICGRLWLNANIYEGECYHPHLRNKPARR